MSRELVTLTFCSVWQYPYVLYTVTSINRSITRYVYGFATKVAFDLTM